jgi:hypothetical protein
LEALPQGFLLHIGGVEDTPKNTLRFAEAKRLLERSLRKTILIQPEPHHDPSAVRKTAFDSPVPISITQ